MKILYYIWLSGLLALSCAYASNDAANGTNTLQSYIVTFKDPTDGSKPFIWPPDPNRIRSNDKPYSEESTTGQSKDVVAQELGLKGTVVRIFETINAIQILATSDEVALLSLDQRVKSVEADKITTLDSADIQNKSSENSTHSGIWQDITQVNHFYTIQEKNDQLILIDLSAIEENRSTLKSAYFGNSNTLVLTRLSPMQVVGDQLQLIFKSTDEATFFPICKACISLETELRKVF